MANPIVVTGGSSGIGRAVVELAASRRIPTFFTYRGRRGPAEDLASAIRARGGEASALFANVAREKDIVELFTKVDELLAGRPLAGLVNSAGIGGPHGPLTSFDEANLAELWATNVSGTILTSREAVRRFRQHGKGGAIVQVSSMAATIGGRPGASAYAASKAAVDTFSVGLAKEVAQENIRVNVVRPGATRTAMLEAVTSDPKALAHVSRSIPIQRIATADEVAMPILWLLSAEASFVTGARLDVSGGGFLIPGMLPSPSDGG